MYIQCSMDSLTLKFKRIILCCTKSVFRKEIICLTLDIYYYCVVFKWVHSLNELRPSFREDGSFDQPDQSLKLLRSFKSLNSANLADVRKTEDKLFDYTSLLLGTISI